MVRTNAKAWILLAAVLTTLAGCERAGVVPVKGTVHYEGQPLPKASVTFLTQDSSGRDAHGFTDENGVFQLTTFEPNDGALPGKYKVIVQVAPEVDTSVIATTPTEAQSAAPVKPKAGGIVIPPQYSQPDQTTLVQEIPATGEIVFDLKRGP